MQKEKDTIPSLRVRRLSLEVGGDEVNDLPHAVPSGGLRLCYRAIDHGRQRDGRVVAPEAGQDVLRHHPDQLAALGFKLSSKDRPQALEPIRSGAQHWEGVSYRSWRATWIGLIPNGTSARLASAAQSAIR